MMTLIIRVFAFIFEDKQSYKRLPMSAKIEREMAEKKVHKNRNLFVVSNTQLVLFAALVFLAFLVVLEFTFVSSCVFMSFMVYVILEQFTKLTRETGLKGRINAKRKLLSIACF